MEFGSIVTIEAASAAKASDGLSKRRQSSQPYVELVWRSESGSGSGKTVQMRPIQDIVDTQLTETRMFTRGWTLQEWLLSPRTLSFGEQQASFDCASGYMDEAGTHAALPRETEHYLRKDSMRCIRAEQGVFQSWLRWFARAAGMPSKVWTPFGSILINGVLQVSRWNRGSCYDYWRNMVERFSSRQLAYDSDRLPALSGLAREIQRATGDTYCAGMWRSELVFSLAWEGGDLFNLHGRNSPEIGPLNIPSRNIEDWPAGIQSCEYVAPSWSWASVKGKIDFMTLDGLPREHTPLASIIGVALQPRSFDSFGVLSDGSYLDIQGPVLRLPNVMARCERTHPHSTLHDYLRFRYTRLSDDWCDEMYQHHREHEFQQCALLKLLRRHGTYLYGPSDFCLLLETCGDSTWRRLCLVKVDIVGSRPRSIAPRYKGERTAWEPWTDLLMGAEKNRDAAMEQCEGASWTTERLRLV